MLNIRTVFNITVIVLHFQRQGMGVQGPKLLYLPFALFITKREITIEVATFKICYNREISSQLSEGSYFLGRGVITFVFLR